MYAVKMNVDKSLQTTIKATIYQYDKNADTLVVLLPMTYEDKNISDCTVLLRYILPNEVGKSEELEMCPEPYKDYYMYRLKVSSGFTDTPGKIEMWVSVIDTHDDLVLKTSSIFIDVHPTKDITRYLSPDDRNQLDKLNEKVSRLEKGKADNLIFDSDGQYLQLTANGSPIGDQVDMSSVGNGVIEFDSSDDAPDHDQDDTDVVPGSVIYF